MPRFRTAALLSLALLAAGPALGQGQIDRDHVPSDERVNLFERRASDIDGNQVRTTIFNFGQTGRTGAVPNEIPYEWPKNTRQHYIALTGLFAGARVQGEDGDTEYIVDVPNYRTNQNNPNEAWTWAPIGGYVNTADEDLGIPRSDLPETWPAFWPDKREDPTDPGWAGSWSGYFGKDVFNADQELYFKMGDDEYARPGSSYYPDSTDRSRRGLGLIAETRVLAWSQVLIDDAVFILHAVKNDGTEDLSSVGVTLWLADLVGGDGDSDDDRPFFDLLLDTAFMTDQDGVGNEAFLESGAQVGAAIAFFLESPGNATDRIDNDGDGSTGEEAAGFNEFGLSVGEPGGPVITLEMIAGEGDQSNTALRFDGVDNNGNGLVDEDSTYAAFNGQAGVGFADYIDNDGDGEDGSPVVTQAMVDEAAGDRWGRWPSLPEPYDGQPVHLIQVGPEDLGRRFRDGLDNDDDCESTSAPFDFLWEPGSPAVTQAMVDEAAADAPYYRYEVPGTDVILYDVRQDDLGTCYADGVDNDGDGAVDEGMDENVDEMIDERRDDGIDNDGDWRAGLDDVGLDGADLTGDTGENDGLPTSGAGTELPGEPNIDVTDVSESDQIGITNVRYQPAGGIQFQTIPDFQLFDAFLVPGRFTTLGPTATPSQNDNDLFVSSGIFPLRAGQTERISFAVILGEVDYAVNAADVQNRYRDLLSKRQNAQEAYEADYRFAQAPVCPAVTAVPGNGQVTLYWDDAAEDSFDSFIADLDVAGLDPRDFEGYRVYRSTDPAFLDARQVTDAFGNVAFLRPIAQFDLLNEHEGFHPVAVQGTQFYLGSNLRDPGEAANGLTHVFTDSTAINGITYYYAVTSYDFGAAPANISPTECSIAISIRADGSIDRLGPNVVTATPSQQAAGYVDPALTIEHPNGFATGEISYRVVDPAVLEDGHLYRVTFRDTLVLGATNAQGEQVAQDTVQTLDYTLTDVTDGEMLVARSETFKPAFDPPVAEGFQLLFDSDLLVSPIDSLSDWESDEIYDLLVRRFELTVPANFPGTRFPADYRIVVGQPGFGESAAFTVNFGIGFELPAKPTNFKVLQKVQQPDGSVTEEEVAYAFWDLTGEGAEAFEVGAAATNLLSADPDALGPGQGESDRIIVLHDIEGDRLDGLTPTWEFLMSLSNAEGRRSPRAGEEALVLTQKPFLASDVYEFSVQGVGFDAELAANMLDSIRVVPNPYVGTNRFEPVNPFPTGRGDRVIRFVNLPPQCTIRIFTLSGRPVRVIEHNTGSNDGVTPDMLLDGSAAWDLLSEDRLAVAYGVYLYHIEAPGVGEITGTFALIK